MKKDTCSTEFPAEMSRDSYFMTTDQIVCQKYEVTAIFMVKVTMRNCGK